MFEKSNLPQSGTVFSKVDHLSSLKKTGKIMKAKMFGYQFSKWTAVLLICFGLVAAGTVHASAGYYKSQPSKHKTVNNINKKVKASTRGGIRSGGSNSRASVDNSVHLNLGNNGSQRSFPSVSRSRSGGNAERNHKNNHKNNNNNNGKNHDNNNKKTRKVIRRVIKKDVDKKVIRRNVDKKIVRKNIDVVVREPYYCDDCYSRGDVTVINDNTNINDNYNKQVVDVSY